MIDTAACWRCFWRGSLCGFVACLLTLCGKAKADPREAAEMPNGALITLHDVPGPCVRGALLAVWQSPDRAITIPACYRLTEHAVLVAFLDGDSGVMPRMAFRRVAGS